jgi:hypothetical protein
MSESRSHALEFYIRHLEFMLRRSLTSEERAFIEGAKPDVVKELGALRELTSSKISKRLDAIALRKRLKLRQGTFMPDFEALYKRKADLDRWLFG